MKKKTLNYGIPTSIRITHSARYDVQMVDEMPDGHGEDVYGYCDGENRVIYLRSQMSRRATLRALAHETLHAIEFEYQIPIPHKLIYELETPFQRLLTLNRWA